MGSILVLGATGAIGAALSRRLRAAGQRPVLAARDPGRLAALGQELDAPFVAGDLSDPALLGEAVAAGGSPLAGLAICVGSIVLKPLRRTTAQDFLDAFRLNALLPALAVQAAAGPLAAGQGSVVLFSSVAARAGFANHAAIAAAKAAVEGLTVSLAAELAPAVRVNCIAPSLTRSGMAAPLIPTEQVAEAIARQHPIPRLGEGEDAAALAAFLLSPQSGWITGQVMAVDGGRSTLRRTG